MDPHRAQVAAAELLGEAFGGCVICDRYLGYHWLDALQQHLCCAHVIRQLVELSEPQRAPGKLGTKLLKAAREVIAIHPQDRSPLDHLIGAAPPATAVSPRSGRERKPAEEAYWRRPREPRHCWPRGARECFAWINTPTTHEAPHRRLPTNRLNTLTNPIGGHRCPVFLHQYIHTLLVGAQAR